MPTRLPREEALPSRSAAQAVRSAVQGGVSGVSGAAGAAATSAASKLQTLVRRASRGGVANRQRSGPLDPDNRPELGRQNTLQSASTASSSTDDVELDTPNVLIVNPVCPSSPPPAPGAKATPASPEEPSVLSGAESGGAAAAALAATSIATAGSTFTAAGCPFCEHFSDPCTLRRDGRLMVPPTVLPSRVGLRDVWDQLFCDSSPFLAEEHDRHGEYTRGPDGSQLPTQMPPWRAAGPSLGWRQLSCYTVVQAPFSTHTKYVERQRFAFIFDPEQSAADGGPTGLMYQVSAQTPDMMYGDYFRCEAIVVFNAPPPDSVDGSCTVEVHGMINVFRSTMMKGKIVSTGTAELTQSYAQFIERAAERLRAGGSQPQPPAALFAEAAFADGDWGSLAGLWQDGSLEGAPLQQHFSDPEALRQTGKCLVSRIALPPGSSAAVCWRRLLRSDSDFLADWHRRHGEYDKGPAGEVVPLSLPQWEGGGDAGPAGWRSFECTTVVQAPWSMHTRFVERQRFAALRLPSAAARVVLQVSARTPDVMLGDCFRCEAVACFEEEAPGGDCWLEVHGTIHMLKSTMMKGKVVSAGIAGLQQSYSDFAQQAVEVLGTPEGTEKSAPAAPPAAPAPAPPAPAAPAAAATGIRMPAGAVAALVIVALLALLTACLGAASAASSLAAAADAAAAVGAALRRADCPAAAVQGRAAALPALQAEVLRTAAATADLAARAAVCSLSALAAVAAAR
eukprot:TRINITY_DN61786_c0_g1_i1.p1 TRINITY_DN61786_c0_g1~~TRINITY_DN61786_c0_g1_i1.p1  ORF type:complete len:763 (+),score=243.87 TRINITY_DN61786_c0_g1_i1:82-2289(+)